MRRAWSDARLDTSRLILIDANIFMYVMGRPHELKAFCRRVLELAASYSAFFTDAEVFQELIHRYSATGRWAAARPQFEAYLKMLRDRTEPMVVADVERAAALVDQHPKMSSRDLIHLAVMQRVGSRHIVTADAAFDGVQGVERLDPARVDEWRSLVTA